MKKTGVLKYDGAPYVETEGGERVYIENIPEFERTGLVFMGTEKPLQICQLTFENIDIVRPEPKEMTIEAIEEQLGHSVKIVK